MLLACSLYKTVEAATYCWRRCPRHSFQHSSNKIHRDARAPPWHAGRQAQPPARLHARARPHAHAPTRTRSHASARMPTCTHSHAPPTSPQACTPAGTRVCAQAHAQYAHTHTQHIHEAHTIQASTERQRMGMECSRLLDMESFKVSPNIFVINSAISACEKCAEWRPTLSLLRQMAAPCLTTR